MTTKNYLIYTNQIGFPVILPVLKGKYGSYTKMNGFNRSIKYALDLGYKEENLSKEEIMQVEKNHEIFRNDFFAKQEILKLKEREEQVQLCLDSEPVEISLKENEICLTVDLSGTKMIEAYHGCGKGTAYTKEGKLIAFHYGYQQPTNAPIDCIVAKVVMSCTQVCF